MRTHTPQGKRVPGYGQKVGQYLSFPLLRDLRCYRKSQHKFVFYVSKIFWTSAHGSPIWKDISQEIRLREAQKQMDIVHFVYIPLFYLNSWPFNFYENHKDSEAVKS